MLRRQEAVRLTAQAIGAKKKLFLCGNGGSAATASHIANDLSCHMKNWQRDAYRIVCLNDSPAVLTSMTNDYGFEHVFEKPLLGLADAGDVLWGFSTSGNSGNVVAARRGGARTQHSHRRFYRQKGAGSCATLSTCGSRPRPTT